jgi:hypothetical protein
MTKYSPLNVLVAFQRMLPDLPGLVGPEWPQIEREVREKLARLRASADSRERMALSTDLVKLALGHEAAHQRLNAELEIQAQLGDYLEEQGIAGEAARASAVALSWSIDPADVPSAEDLATRKVTIRPGGIDGGKSVKLRNLRLDLGEFSELAAGAMVTGMDIIDKPHALIIAAGVLLTVRALTKAMTVEIGEQEASVFWGFVQVREADNCASEAAILETTNAERAKYGMEPLTNVQFRNALRRLEQLKSIAPAGDPGRWRIIERYKIEE